MWCEDTICKVSLFGGTIFAAIELIGWFGILMFLLLSLALSVYSLAFIIGISVDIDGIRDPLVD